MVTTAKELRHADFQLLVDLLAEQAAAAADGGVSGFFRDLVRAAELPQAMRQERAQWGGNPQSNAIDVVRWAQSKGMNPANPRWSVLGSVLLTLFVGAGLEQAALLASLIVAYRMCRDEQELQALVARYQIPQLAMAGAEHGPDIDWRGPPEVELQGWFHEEPDLLDVGVLRRAIARAASVCRVEVGSTGASGTGVLIDTDLVLTNFHVLGENPAAVAQAARATRLRFGAFTAKGGDEAAGQLVALDAAQPVMASSPISALDFVLLRASADIGGLKDVAPAAFSLSNPAARAGVSILQHPQGKAMMLAMSANGVTGAYPDSGLLQYVSRTAPGSSGGPCFDDDWRVVAIHHAVRSKALGAIGEGILMSSIYPIIQNIVQSRPD